MYGSSSKDLNLPYPPAAPFDGHRKEESDLHRHHQQMSSGLLRYRSAPSSLLGEVCEDFLPVRPSSPETETMFARFLAAPDLRDEIRDKPPAAAGGGGQGGPQFPPPPASAAMEHGGAPSPQQMLYHSPQHQQQHQISSQGSADGSAYRVVSSMAMEAEQLKSGGNCSNLIRQSSSPAGLFSHLNVENGYGVMRGVGGAFRNGNGSIGEAGMGPATRLKSQLSFSSRQASSAGLMSQISEIGSEGMGGSSPEESGGGMGGGNSGGGGRCYIPGYPISSWEDSPLLSDGFSSGLKRPREVDSKILPEPQNGEVRNHSSGLTHQFSLPKTATEMVAIEKFLQFQDSVPCKIRAKRGCATHPRSIAERVRRTRISERMRKLQELVPNMDKQTNTADMLDLAVDYIKDLQKQVKTLSDSRANCTCSSSKSKPYPNPTM